MRAPFSATPRPPGSLLAALIIGPVLFALAGCREGETKAAPPPPIVGVVPARLMTVPLLATPTGTTRSLQEVAVRARVRGFLTAQHFREGSFVKQGQLLFIIDEEPYQVALKSAEARRDAARAALMKARASKAREVAAAQIAVDEAQLALARIEEGRRRALISRNAAPQQELDQATAQRQRYDAQVAADQATADQAKADYDVDILAAQARLDEAEAAVRNAELDLGYCRIKAPIDGRIGEAMVKVGNLVGPSAPGGADNTQLAVVQQLDPMGIDMRISSRYLERAPDLIRDRLSVSLTRTGIEGEREHAYSGRLYFFDNNIDPTSSTFLMKAEVPNPLASLLPGEYVKLKMTVGTLKDAVVVPEQAVAETQAGPVVYIVDKEGKVAIQRVEAAQTYEGIRVVAKGLEPGRQVIVEGRQLARPGIVVKTEPARLSAPVDATLADASDQKTDGDPPAE